MPSAIRSMACETLIITPTLLDIEGTYTTSLTKPHNVKRKRVKSGDLEGHAILATTADPTSRVMVVKEVEDIPKEMWDCTVQQSTSFR
jgi:hypothetical protein